MTAERRWYEPPTPRDWRRPSLAELQSLESSTALRKAILERNSSTPAGKTVDLASHKSSSSSGRSTISEVDKNILERNFPVTPIDPLNSPHARAMRPPAGRDGKPYSLRRKKTFTDLSDTYFFDKDWHGSDPLERPAVSLPGSRPRSSTMTKYAPLPSITSSKESQSQPPPLIRSKTFDVIDTKMKNLPTVDDSSVISRQKSEEEEEPPYVVTVSIEGKTLKEYMSHARDGLLRSRPATKYGRSDQTHENPLLGVSWVSEKPLLYQVHLPQTKESSTKIARLGGADDGESEGDEGAGEEGSDTVMEATDKDNQENDDGNDVSNNNIDDEENENENTKGKDDDSNNEDSDDDDDDNSDDEESDDEDSDEEDSDDDDDSDECDETKENNAMRYPQVEEQPRGDDDDINVYFMLPDNSLLLARTTPLWTLTELLGVARGVRVDGRRLKVLLDGVHPQDLHTCLRDLGITHNTTVYLLETAG
ncbi:uncharacterized protein LOC126981070 [Eriocheir sinensis]|uniref:uncharacterized protein LOC126981070 n=1 Tax=Eriocheir sinensis TaxID=95602 RepID=UPI0021C8BAAE|nr:uncharacterized protein LOC126981070 [Eriocheir sinensis]XP_050687704.1 uncharacterized protein LOC126981070 [Eriocheir sinensis]